jgi:hypothetical protein
MALSLDTAALVAATIDHRPVGLTRTDISINADVYTIPVVPCRSEW